MPLGQAFVPDTAPGGGSLDVYDEGVLETTTANKLNFTGPGVTATDDGSGGTDIDIPGGTGRHWDPSAIPTDAAVQSARTLDFSTSPSLASFTWTNQGSATAAIQRQRLYMTAPSNGGVSHSKRLYTPNSTYQVPATPWCIQVPVTLYGSEPYPIAGIYIKNTANSKGLAAGIQIRDDVGRNHLLVVTTMTNETTAVADLIKHPADPFGVLAVSFDGTTFSWYYSPDGRDWPPVANLTQTAATHIGAGGTYEWSFFVDSLAARASSGAFLNSVILNQVTPVPHGQFV